MNVRPHVFTRRDGTQVLLLIYPDGRMTIADRDSSDHSWGPPINEDRWYRDYDPRPIDEVVAMVTGQFGEAL